MRRRTPGVWVVLGVCLGSPLLSAATRSAVCTPKAIDVPPTVAESAVPCVDGFAGIYPCANVDLQAVVPLAVMGCNSGNSIYGWTDPVTGHEWALMGCDNGLSFVDISTPTAPVFVGRLPGHGGNDVADSPDHGPGDSIWRDMRTIGNYVFVGSEAAGHGLQVFDLTQLRAVASPPVLFTETAHYDGYGHSHTTAADPDTNFVYGTGSDTCAGGLHMVDVSNPLVPTFAGCVSQDGYVHETQCVIYHGPDTNFVDHEVCFNANEDTLTIVDVTDKSAPVQLSRTGYAGYGYTHQAWLTEDHSHLLLDDELDEANDGHNSYTYIWDTGSLTAPVLLGHYTGPTKAIDHNLYIHDGYAFESNYRAGLRILDATGAYEALLAEVAYFDIWPSDNEPEFNANWNNYPFFASGNVILSGIEQGLYVVKPNLNPYPTTLSISNVDVAEGNAGPQVASFGVHLSVASPQTVIVNYTTSPVDATPGEDYEPVSGVLTFLPNETDKVIAVNVLGDTLDEDDETFQVQLSGAVNASIAIASAAGRILDDDPTPLLAISDPTVVEGDGPGAIASFTVSLSAASGRTVTVSYATVSGTAGGSDYTPKSGSVVLAPGIASGTIDVAVTGDERDESDEVFYVNLSSPTNATLADSQGMATIVDDDTLLVSAVSPSSGSAGGGAAVTITGESFMTGAAVAIGGAAATGVTVPDSKEIQATTPALAPGTLNDVTVSLSGLPTAVLSGGYLADFLDVPEDHLFHDFVEAILRAGITAGCGNGNYCVDDSVTREQMAVFLLKSEHGSGYAPPPCTGIFADVACSPGVGFPDWIEQLYAEQITGGCVASPLQYCPGHTVTRAEMAVFLLKAKHGTGYVPDSCAGIFADVACPATPAFPFSDWIEQLYADAITGGCATAPLRYCPDNPNLRGEMAVFLAKTFLP